MTEQPPVIHKHDDMLCDKEYESKVKEQKFCSHNCYIRNRFWREEDTIEIVKMLLAPKKIPMIPKWIKDLLEI